MDDVKLNLNTKVSDLSIDQLKNNYTRLYYFGLGFIQLKLDETYRLHFYTDQLDQNTDSVHNHRYDFTSKILKGSFTNRIYDLVEGDKYLLTNESCNPDIEAPELQQDCDLTLREEKRYVENEIYTMHHKDLHQVESKYAITLLERSEYKQDFAQVILNKKGHNNCPFAVKIPDSKLWEIIRSMLND